MHITFDQLFHYQDQPQLPLLCQLCVTPHQLWLVSSLQCMVENVWTIMWSLLSVMKKREMYHVTPPVVNMNVVSLLMLLQMTTSLQSML